MAYNLRSRGFQKSLPNNKDVENDFGGSGSENDEVICKKELEFNDESIDFDGMETKVETDQEILGSCAQSRPTTDLRGNNGYVWNTQQPQRHSGILKYTDITPRKKRVYLEKRVRCKLCPPRKDRKTREQCSCCQRPMCNQHRAFMCVDCIGAD